MLKLLTIAALAAAAALTPPTVQAANDINGVASAKVSLAGLNLSSQAGAWTAMRRIHNAAQAVCGGQSTTMDLTQQRVARRCVAEATGRAVATVNAPLLSALNSQRGPGRTQMAQANR